MDKTGGVVILHYCESDATEPGIQKSVLKAPTSALSYSKTQTEELHSFLPRVCLGKLVCEGNACQHRRKDSFFPVQTYSLSFDFHTVSSNMACRQEILIKHLWKSKSHKSLVDLLLPYIHPFQVSHKNQQPPTQTFFPFS